jgi:hypothetical protein
MSFCLSCICCSSSVCSGHSACGSSSQLMSISGARYALHAHSTVHTYMQPANGRAPPKRVFKQMLLSCACYERMHTGPVMTPGQPRPREQLCRGGAAAARHSRQASIHHGHVTKQASKRATAAACVRVRRQARNSSRTKFRQKTCDPRRTPRRSAAPKPPDQRSPRSRARSAGCSPA